MCVYIHMFLKTKVHLTIFIYFQSRTLVCEKVLLSFRRRTAQKNVGRVFQDESVSAYHSKTT
jgi:hypothetical protein